MNNHESKRGQFIYLFKKQKCEAYHFIKALTFNYFVKTNVCII